MYELNQVAENTFYINCPSKIGVYRVSKEEVWLIDSGNDKDAGRKIQKILDQQGWKLAGIINTHSNADHIGGNTLLQDRLGCAIYSTPMENTVIENPMIEPSFLYGGYPFKKLRNKFLMATPSKAQDVSFATLPHGMETFPLGGHFWQMIGVKTPDNVYFLADSVFSETILEKYHISFNYDIEAFFKTLDFIDTLEGSLYIPAHGDPTTDIRPLVEINRQKANEIIAKLEKICLSPKFFEEILHDIFERFALTMDYGQYVLVGSTIRSYLSYLYDTGKMEAFVENNYMLWKTIDPACAY
ncbi:MBL fold metallo-hydrolase [Anaerotignum sp. MB30-C6]|uniref:MBL fold metallo-hydrolase n=1 Tax=Anaerotignum sp. MB30-C6 TaxID=3070814 RepID=UPI0027DC2590|nr:MBL fold metallo-hydrolase [Anaerotignum sp. MB30-C6]WMI80511.1 MBL fold metallo-hydrolase [Anaerotignum sp. MB30-C6]